jgi:hypothetical protein
MKVLYALCASTFISTMSIVSAQEPGLAVGFGQFQHTVLDNDRSDFFYADAFGMTIRQVPGNPYGALPGDGGLTDTPPRSRLIRSGGLFGMAGRRRSRSRLTAWTGPWRSTRSWARSCATPTVLFGPLPTFG